MSVVTPNIPPPFFCFSYQASSWIIYILLTVYHYVPQLRYFDKFLDINLKLGYHLYPPHTFPVTHITIILLADAAYSKLFKT
jgi:hypothetical protein